MALSASRIAAYLSTTQSCLSALQGHTLSVEALHDLMLHQKDRCCNLLEATALLGRTLHFAPTAVGFYPPASCALQKCSPAVVVFEVVHAPGGVAGSIPGFKATAAGETRAREVTRVAVDTQLHACTSDLEGLRQIDSEQ